MVNITVGVVGSYCWNIKVFIKSNKQLLCRTTDSLSFLGFQDREVADPIATGDNEKTTTVIIKGNLKVLCYIFKFFPHCSSSLSSSSRSPCYTLHVPETWHGPFIVAVVSFRSGPSCTTLPRIKLFTLEPQKGAEWRWKWRRSRIMNCSYNLSSLCTRLLTILYVVPYPVAASK